MYQVRVECRYCGHSEWQRPAANLLAALDAWAQQITALSDGDGESCRLACPRCMRFELETVILDPDRKVAYSWPAK